MKLRVVSVFGLALLSASCGKPDASGVYVATSDREVVFVQLVQSKDDTLSGRMEVSTIGSDGNVSHKDGSFSGSISGHDLVLRPSSVWLGGVGASGTFSGNKLTLSANGSTLEASRSSLDDYQGALAKLQSKAGEESKRVAEANAEIATQQAQARDRQQVSDAAVTLSNITTAVNRQTGALNEAIANCPNFGAMAAANTSKVAELLRRANGQSDLARNQLGVAANQIGVQTNQIEVARSQYAIQLNNIVEDVKQAALPLGKLCGASPRAELVSACSSANAAAEQFKTAFQRGKEKFTPYKGRVEAEIERQDRLAAQIDS